MGRILQSSLRGRVTGSIIGLALVVAIVLSIVPAACSKSERETGVSATIGSSGGVVEVVNESSAIYGVKVSVPEGALEEDIYLTIDVAEQASPLTEAFVRAADGVQLGPEGTTFQIPVTITIPYHDEGIDEGTIGVWKSDTGSQDWAMIATDNIDTNLDTITLQTYDFSDFHAMALRMGAELPSQSPDAEFDPGTNGLKYAKAGYCYGEVYFVQWFWMNKRSEGPLSEWHKDNQTQIAKMAYCTLLANNLLQVMVSDNKDTFVQNLKESLSTPGQLVAVGIGATTKDSYGLEVLSRHAILVYDYKPSGNGVIFDAYDPNASDKTCTLAYDGVGLTYSNSTGIDITFTKYLGGCSLTAAVEFVYEYFENPPEITDASPTGVVDKRRPKISAVIHYPLVDKYLVLMKVNGEMVVPDEMNEIDTGTLGISSTPKADLPEGVNRVTISRAQGRFSRDPVHGGDNWCAEPIPDYTWTFTIGTESTIIGTWELLTINGEKPSDRMTLTFTGNTVTSTSAGGPAGTDCTEVSTYSISGGILSCVSVLSVSGSACGDDVGDSFTLGPFTVTETTLTVTMSDPSMGPPTAVFVFARK